MLVTVSTEGQLCYLHLQFLYEECSVFSSLITAIWTLPLHLCAGRTCREQSECTGLCVGCVCTEGAGQPVWYPTFSVPCVEYKGSCLCVQLQWVSTDSREGEWCRMPSGGVEHPAVTKPVLATPPDVQESAATCPLTLAWDGKGEKGPKMLLIHVTICVK